jgi:glycosyltransferase involved in cell wall biosynthesis
MTKIHICYPFKGTPWGGGNQFLKLLKKELKLKNCYAESLDDAEIVIINSHHVEFSSVINIIKLVWKKNIVVMHRIDGPISHIRSSSREVDNFIYQINALLSSITVFQSKWSKDRNYDLGINRRDSDIVIYNASDSNIFINNRIGKSLNQQKIRLITTSWSTNKKKGKKIYDFLDSNLNFDKYEYIFVGNYDGKFKNIKHISPVSSEDLFKYLVDSSIFITASEDDPCSNSVIEAMTVGLPVVALNSGGHPELVGLGGELFNGPSDVLSAIDKVSNSMEEYRTHIQVMDAKEVADMYYKQAIKFQSDESKKKFKLAWVLVRYCYYALIYRFLFFTSRVSNKIVRIFL